MFLKKSAKKKKKSTTARVAGNSKEKKNLFLSKGNRIENGQGTSIPRTRSSVYGTMDDPTERKRVNPLI